MIVQGFWHGKIGTMERMCVNSYIRAGIEFHLYSYAGDLLSLSSYVSMRDASEIVPKSMISLFPWSSIFSDYFRYALLEKMGGWWVDMDTICLKPFDDSWPYTFAQDNIDHYYVSGYVMKAPAGSEIMSYCRNLIQSMTAEDRAKLGHMDIGPYLLQKQIPDFGLNQWVAPAEAFDPSPWNHVPRLVDPNRTTELVAACDKSYLIHLRQSIWNEGPNSSAGILPDGTKIMTDGIYPEGCLWEQLKRRFL